MVFVALDRALKSRCIYMGLRWTCNDEHRCHGDERTRIGMNAEKSRTAMDSGGTKRKNRDNFSHPVENLVPKPQNSLICPTALARVK